MHASSSEEEKPEGSRQWQHHYQSLFATLTATRIAQLVSALITRRPCGSPQAHGDANFYCISTTNRWRRNDDLRVMSLRWPPRERETGETWTVGALEKEAISFPFSRRGGDGHWMERWKRPRFGWSLPQHLAHMHRLQLKTLTGWLVGWHYRDAVGLFLNGRASHNLRLKLQSSKFSAWTRCSESSS
jgi:hypothetical protein